MNNENRSIRFVPESNNIVRVGNFNFIRQPAVESVTNRNSYTNLGATSVADLFIEREPDIFAGAQPTQQNREPDIFAGAQSAQQNREPDIFAGAQRR